MSDPKLPYLTPHEPAPVALPGGAEWHPGWREGTDDELSAWAWAVNDRDQHEVLRKVASDVRSIPPHQHIGHRWAGRIAGSLDCAAGLLERLADIVATDTRPCATCGHPANEHGRQCWHQTTKHPTFDHWGRGPVTEYPSGQVIHGGTRTAQCPCPRFLAPESAAAIQSVADAAMKRLAGGT